MVLLVGLAEGSGSRSTVSVLWNRPSIPDCTIQCVNAALVRLRHPVFYKYIRPYFIVFQVLSIPYPFQVNNNYRMMISQAITIGTLRIPI